MSSEMKSSRFDLFAKIEAQGDSAQKLWALNCATRSGVPRY